MKKSLLEEFTLELDKIGLDFRVTKECNDKYKGIITDKKTLTEVPYELHKSLQRNLMKQHIVWCKNYMSLAIKLKDMGELK